MEHLSWSSSSEIVVDLTVGGGGHLEALLKACPRPLKVYAVDRDPYALERAKSKLEGFPDIIYLHERFDLALKKIPETPTRLLADLGVSSFQLDNAVRGFSFREEGPLDMRMDTTRGITAREWLEGVSEKGLSDILWEFGEEKRSRVLARRFVHERKSRPLATTKDLVECFGYRLDSRDPRGHHPLTRVFQAIRIYVNEEFQALQSLLEEIPTRMAVGGRLAIITFHSLEDRLVKWSLRDRLKPVNKKVIIASEEESDANPRSRSAKLRVYEKIE